MKPKLHQPWRTTQITSSGKRQDKSLHFEVVKMALAVSEPWSPSCCEEPGLSALAPT